MLGCWWPSSLHLNPAKSWLSIFQTSKNNRSTPFLRIRQSKHRQPLESGSRVRGGRLRVYQQIWRLLLLPLRNGDSRPDGGVLLFSRSKHQIKQVQSASLPRARLVWYLLQKRLKLGVTVSETPETRWDILHLTPIESQRDKASQYSPE